MALTRPFFSNELEQVGKFKFSENPPRSLRLGYGGRSDPCPRGHQQCLFQVVWQLPEASRRPRANHLAASGPDHSDLNWLGQELGDFSAIEHSKVENWRSPHRARTRGLIP